MKEKIKTKSFWLSVVAAVVLVLQNVGLKIDVPYINQIVESLCALMIVLGIFTAPSPTKKADDSDKKDIDKTQIK